MGDLIIKPASSGSLKIQDQAGTAHITTGTSSGLTLGSTVAFPTGHLLKMSTVYKTSDQDESGDANYKEIFNTADHVCHGGSGNNTTIYPFFDVTMYGRNDSYRDNRKNMRVTYTGVTHSPTVTNHEYTLGAYLAYTDAATREFMWHQLCLYPMLPFQLQERLVSK